MGNVLTTILNILRCRWTKTKKKRPDISVKYVSNPKNEKCYDPKDKTLKFVDREDELDFFCTGYKSKRALLSCGHATTPMSLTVWCRRQLYDGKCKFVCGQSGCNAEWPFEEVRKMALLTPKEVEEFERQMFSNAAANFLDVKACPGCKSLVQRTDYSDLSVNCTLCSAKKKKTYIFCWQCLREWKGLAPRADRCDNAGCCSEPLETLMNCPDVVLRDVSGVSGCPCFRACPTCGLIVGHNGNACKNVVCTRCNVEFCFVCLNTTVECQRLNPRSYYSVCSSGVAPRQTSIPVWRTT